jgi:hypothetical protein
MNEKDTICNLEKRFAIEFSYATLKFAHRKHQGAIKLYITTKGCYKVDSGRLISFYFPSIYLIKSDYINLTYTYRTDNETQSNRHEGDSHDR